MTSIVDNASSAPASDGAAASVTPGGLSAAPTPDATGSDEAPPDDIMPGVGIAEDAGDAGTAAGEGSERVAASVPGTAADVAEPGIAEPGVAEPGFTEPGVAAP
jgi:hypothetical protein